MLRVFAWSCVISGILLAVAAFVVTANSRQSVAHARGGLPPHGVWGDRADHPAGSL